MSVSNYFHPLVSIIIPVINKTIYFQECIESVIAQTYDNIEIIVVKVGGDENSVTKSFVSSYGENVWYYSIDSGGISAALNLGVQKMTGEFFSWLSPQDKFLPHKIASQIKFIDDFELTDCIVFGNFNTVDDAGIIIATNEVPFVSVGDVYFKLYLQQWIYGCTILVPKSLMLGKVLFSENFNTIYDYAFLLKIAQRTKLVYQAEVVVDKRVTNDAKVYVPISKTELNILFNENFENIFQYLLRFHYKGEQTLSAALTEIIVMRYNQKQWYAVWYAFANSIKFTRSLSTTLRSINNLILLALKFKFPSIYNFFAGKLGHLGRSIKGGSTLHRVNFHQVYEDDGFYGGGESASGGGSTEWITRVIRRNLPDIFQKYGITSLLDIPCGDFNWMRHVEMSGIHYIGGDIVPGIVESNKIKYGSDNRTFEVLDLVNGELPKADMVLCRDCLVHLPFVDIVSSLQNIKASGATWLLTTTFNEHADNQDLVGVWRPLNLCKPPFNFPTPEALLNEKCVEGGGLFRDKCLGLWRLDLL